MDQPESSGAQPSAQPEHSSGARLGFAWRSPSIISRYLTVINHFVTITYETQDRTSNPKVAGSGSEYSLVRGEAIGRIRRLEQMTDKQFYESIRRSAIISGNLEQTTNDQLIGTELPDRLNVLHFHKVSGTWRFLPMVCDRF